MEEELQASSANPAFLPPQTRQIMKKWADLKCDGKRRIVALRGPNGAIIRKKTLGPVEKMVQDILMMSPRGGEPFCSR